jgi:hypothetical protein
LDWNRKYDLTGCFGHRSQPHIEFLNLKSDDDLASFVRRRGPLWWAYRKGQQESKVLGDKRKYWAFHRGLKAKLQLVAAFRSGKKSELADAIIACIAADDEHRNILADNRSSEDWETTDLEFPAFSAWLETEAKPDLDFKEWIRQKASADALGRMAGWWIEARGPSVKYGLGAVRRKGHGDVFRQAHVSTLAEAIQWMFYQDLTDSRSLTFCRECGIAFRPDSSRARKYHDPLCAHRRAQREYRKRLKTKRRRGGNQDEKTKETATRSLSP